MPIAGEKIVARHFAEMQRLEIVHELRRDGMDRSEKAVEFTFIEHSDRRQ